MLVLPIAESPIMITFNKSSSGLCDIYGILFFIIQKSIALILRKSRIDIFKQLLILLGPVECLGRLLRCFVLIEFILLVQEEKQRIFVIIGMHLSELLECLRERLFVVCFERLLDVFGEFLDLFEGDGRPSREVGAVVDRHGLFR